MERDLFDAPEPVPSHWGLILVMDEATRRLVGAAIVPHHRVERHSFYLRQWLAWRGNVRTTDAGPVFRLGKLPFARVFHTEAIRLKRPRRRSFKR